MSAPPADWLAVAAVTIALLTFVSAQLESIRIKRASLRRIAGIRNGTPAGTNQRLDVRVLREQMAHLRREGRLGAYRQFAVTMFVIVVARGLALALQPGKESPVPEYVYAAALLLSIVLLIAPRWKAP